MTYAPIHLIIKIVYRGLTKRFSDIDKHEGGHYLLSKEGENNGTSTNGQTHTHTTIR